jgi:hypothetical protein
MKKIGKLSQIVVFNVILFSFLIYIGTMFICGQVKPENSCKIDTLENSENSNLLNQVIFEKNDWDYLVQALIYHESRNNDSAVGPTSDIGCLQITPIYVREANRLIGEQKFTLNDRYCRSKSLEMFDIVQSHHNPNRDISRAIKLHNPKAPETYAESVLRYFEHFKKLDYEQNRILLSNI